MSNGLDGIIAAETVLSHSDGDTGTIWLRGQTVEVLVKNHGYEGAVAILWEGFVGDGLTRTKIQNELGAARERAFGRLDEWFGAAAKRPIIEGLRIALAALPEQSTPVEIAATFPVAVAALIRTRDGAATLKPDASLTTVADFLRMMKGAPADENEIRALDCYFTSMSASRDIEGWIERKLASGGRLMGFGHRIFRVPDARVPVLRAAVAALGKDAKRVAFAAEVEKAALAALRRHKPSQALPNIEMNAAVARGGRRAARRLHPGIRHRPLGRLDRPCARATNDRPDDPPGLSLHRSQAGDLTLAGRCNVG